jgi:quinol monooxygenase YgiN
MTRSEPVTMLVTYRPKPGKEKELQALVEKHWPTLDRVGLVTKEPAKIWRATDKRSGASYFVEWFRWKDGEASETAHQTPEVMAVWEPMGPILEELTLAQIEPIP